MKSLGKRFLISAGFLFSFTVAMLLTDQNVEKTVASNGVSVHDSKSSETKVVEKHQPSNPVNKSNKTSVALDKKAVNERHIVKSGGLNVRSLPSSEAEILLTLDHNQLIYIKSKFSNGWLELKSGGYVNGKYTSKVAVNITGKKSVVSNGKKSIGEKVNTPSNLTAEEAEYLLKGTALRGHGIGKAAVAAEQRTGVNAFFTIAVAKLESNNGKSGLANDRNNLFGIRAYDGKVRKYASRFEKKSDSVHEFSGLINRVYVSRGLKTVTSINKLYCPTDNTWGPQVLSIMRSDMQSLKHKS